MKSENEKWYKIVLDDESTPNSPFYVHESDFQGVREDDLKAGKFISSWSNKCSFTCVSKEDEGEMTDFLFNYLALPLVSLKCKEIIRGAMLYKDDIQFLPVEIRMKDGSTVDIYYIINVLAFIVALDREKCFLFKEDKSNINKLTNLPEVTGLGKAVLLGKAIENHDIIRTSEYFPSVFMSPRIQKALVKNRCTGVIFSPIKVT